MKRLYLQIVCLISLFWTPWVLGAEADIGVILLHGKWDRQPTVVAGLARQLESRGFKVATPEMPWSWDRQYDADYVGALVEIEASAKSLKAKGAKRIIVAGHSFGANAALAFAGAGKEIDGVMALAPGHTPDRAGFQKIVGGSVAKARELIAEGKGSSKGWFDDPNQGQTKSVQTTAIIYLSYFDPDGMASMPRNAVAIKRSVPFLWIIGKDDRLLTLGAEYVYDKLPKHPASRYVVVSGGHVDTPDVGAEQIIEWLMSLGY